MLCDAAPITAIRQPAGPAHYQVGQLTLADGTTFEVWGDANGAGFVKALRIGDRVEMAFGPTQRWADEAADARPAFAVAVRAGDTYTSVGVPGKAAVICPPRSEGGARRRPTAP